MIEELKYPYSSDDVIRVVNGIGNAVKAMQPGERPVIDFDPVKYGPSPLNGPDPWPYAKEKDVVNPDIWPDAATREAAERPRVGDKWCASSGSFGMVDYCITGVANGYVGYTVKGGGRDDFLSVNKERFVNNLKRDNARLVSRGPEPKPDLPDACRSCELDDGCPSCPDNAARIAAQSPKPDKPLRDGDVCFGSGTNSPYIIDNNVHNDDRKIDVMDALRAKSFTNGIPGFNILDLADLVRKYDIDFAAICAAVQCGEKPVMLTEEEIEDICHVAWNNTRRGKTLTAKLRAAMEK